MRSVKKHTVLSLFLILLLVAAVPAAAEGTDGAALSFPALTQTDCVWDENGDLIEETAHTLAGTISS